MGLSVWMNVICSGVLMVTEADFEKLYKLFESTDSASTRSLTSDPETPEGTCTSAQSLPPVNPTTKLSSDYNINMLLNVRFTFCTKFSNLNTN